MKRFQSVTLGGGSGGSSSSGITIGTSVITGGTDTRVLFDDNGVIGEDAGLVFNKTTNVLTAGEVISSGLTASRIVVSDASKQLASNGSITTNALTRSASSGASLAAASATDDGSITTLTLGSKVVLGTGTGFGTLGGLIAKAAPNVATTGTTEEVLATITIPANTLTVNGAMIEVYIMGKSAANGNNKSLKVRMGGLAGVVVFGDPSVTNPNNFNHYTVTPIKITRLSATTADSFGQMYWGADKAAASLTQSYSDRSLAITWANSNDLVITAVTASAAGDYTLLSYQVVVRQ